MNVMTNKYGFEFPELLSERGWLDFGAARALSERELMVLRLLCRGLSNAALANALGIQLPTLRTHLRSIYQKLSCASRIQAVLCVVHARAFIGPDDSARHARRNRGNT